MGKRKEHGWNYKSRIKILSFIPQKSRSGSRTFYEYLGIFFCIFHFCKDPKNMKHSHEMWENHFRLLGSGMFGFIHCDLMPNLISSKNLFLFGFYGSASSFSSFLISRIFHFHINSNQGFWLQNCVRKLVSVHMRWGIEREKNERNKSRNCTMFFIARGFL